MFYGTRVNSALATLGIAPMTFTTDYRRSMQKVGEAAGNSPQEVALCMVAELPIIHRINIQPAVIKGWVRERKIDPRAPEVSDALGKLALWDLMT